MTAGRGPVRVGPLLLPGEGGVYGVWLAGLAFGVQGLGGAPGPAALGALGGSLASLLLLERVRRGSPLAAAPVVILYAPVLYYGAPASLAVAAAAVGLLAAALGTRGMIGVVSGGALLGAHGGLLWAAGRPWDLLGSLAPLAYSLLTVSHAACVVSRRVDLYAVEVSLAYAAQAVLVAGLAASARLPAAVLVAVDAAVRAALLHSGAFARVRLKVYGFHEVFHSLAFMALLALLL